MDDAKLRAEAQKLVALYVEDDPVTRELFKLTLERCFKEVLVAANGREGLEIYRFLCCLGNSYCLLVPA